MSNALEEADYPHFWATLDSDDLYADLVADCSGFEELVRLRIAMAVAQAFREISRDILESYLNATGEFFDGFVKNICQWTLDGDKVKIPLNKENEAITTVTREVVKIERMLMSLKIPTLSVRLLTLLLLIVQSLAESLNARMSSLAEVDSTTFLSFKKFYEILHEHKQKWVWDLWEFVESPGAAEENIITNRNRAVIGREFLPVDFFSLRSGGRWDSVFFIFFLSSF